MTIKLELDIEKTDTGKFNARIACNSADGEGHAFLSLLQDSPIKAIEGALEPILIITPNLTQHEVDKHYELYS